MHVWSLSTLYSALTHVCLAVTVGAVSVLLLLVRTSMEEPVKKKFSPM